MGKPVNYFLYFIVAVYSLADIRTSVGQWARCEGNPKLTNSAIWKCVKRAKCVHAKTLPPKLTVICGRDELCCPESTTTSPPPVKKPTPTMKTSTSAPGSAFARANRIALNMCIEYAQYRFLNSTMESPFIGEPDIPISQLNCTKIENLILNGDPAELTEYPHMALLGYDEDLTDSTMWRCGGSLISEQFILSAAHCTKTPGSNIEVKWAALGLLSRDEITENSVGKNVFRIVKRINHPQYQTGKAYNDIALFKLEYPVQFSPTIRPICLQYLGPLQTNTAVSVTGWGKTFADSIESDVLLKTTIRSLPSNLCTKTYKNDETLSKGFDANIMICGGDRSGKNDTCGGDSGGPMQIPMPRKECTWIQVGVTSRGPANCGETPAIYTKVAYFLPWIQRLVWPTATNGTRS